MFCLQKSFPDIDDSDLESSLGKLNLYRNKISGENSNCFDDMTALLHVDISYNALSGLIPNSRVFANALKNYEGIVVCVEMLKDCNLVQILLYPYHTPNRIQIKATGQSAEGGNQAEHRWGSESQRINVWERTD
ncbi:hypothetical protein LguiB_013592 [Lonicera macranthoides]